jgi:feruloyl-CoA synthase
VITPAVKPEFRPLLLGAISAPSVTTRSDGSMLIDSCEPLGNYPERITDRLEYWATIDPERICAAQRDDKGQWRLLRYGALLTRAKRIGAALLRRNLSVERPIMILSGNDLEQLELTLAAMWVGIPVAPVSPAYSLVSSDLAKLQYLLDLMTPGMVYASDAMQFERALKKIPAGIEIVVAHNDAAGHYTAFQELDDGSLAVLDEAHAKVGADTIAKFLFTSGSTKQPKAVPNTQRMLCSNQQMLQQTFAFVTVTPPVLVDWLPWHHTFGGNHNLNLVICNGGTIYIDEGKPTPAMIGHTLKNLAEIAPTIYFNVPKGWEDIAHVMRHDPALRDRFFSRVEMLFYAGAGLSHATWNLVDELAMASVGKKIRMLAGLGMTETAPSAMFCFSDTARSGEVGIPVPGCRVKLAPVDGKLEARFSGPNVMKGYWRTPELNQGVFDDEGFFCTGDALKPMHSAEPERGFLFDGRLAEDFKLSSGTFVSVGPLRARVIAAGAPLIQDVVLAGLNRDHLAAIIFPRADLCIKLAKEQGDPCASLAEALSSKAVRSAFELALAQVNQQATGSASRIELALVTAEPASMDRGEITDKGSINQRAVLLHRGALVDSMYQGTASDLLVLKVKNKNEEMVRD